MVQHEADLVVTVAEPALTWTFRIQGVAEAPADSTLHTFTVKARESLDTHYPFTLVGLELGPRERYVDALTCELEVPPQYQALVSRCFEVELCDPPEGVPRNKMNQ